MIGPIDYIIVGFEGNKFDGSILKALGEVIDKGVVRLVSLVLIIKDNNGKVSKVDVANLGDSYAVEFAAKNLDQPQKVTDEDIDEMSELLENNTSAGMVVLEHVWAIPFKKALLDANGVLVAEGRIHPDAVVELDK